MSSWILGCFLPTEPQRELLIRMDVPSERIHIFSFLIGRSIFQEIGWSSPWAQWGHDPVVSVEAPIGSPSLCSGDRIWHFSNGGVGHRFSSDSIPGCEFPYSTGTGKNQKKYYIHMYIQCVINIAVSCGIDRRCGSNAAWLWLWLWPRPAAVPRFHP